MEMVSSRTCVLEGGVDGVASPEENQGLMNPAPPAPVPRRVCARWSGRGRGAGGCEGRGRVVERLGRRARDAGGRTTFAGRELACGGLDSEGSRRHRAGRGRTVGEVARGSGRRSRQVRLRHML